MDELDAGALDDGAGAGDGPREDDGPAPAHVSLKVDSVRHLFSILSAIHNGRKDAYAMMTANYKGAQ